VDIPVCATQVGALYRGDCVLWTQTVVPLRQVRIGASTKLSWHYPVRETVLFDRACDGRSDREYQVALQALKSPSKEPRPAGFASEAARGEELSYAVRGEWPTCCHGRMSIL